MIRIASAAATAAPFILPISWRRQIASIVDGGLAAML